MKVFKLELGELQTNCYIVPTKQNNAIVIDPADNCEKIMQTLADNNLKAEKILLTHGHFDHTGACAELAEKTGAKVYLHENDVELVNDTRKNVRDFIFPQYDYKPYKVDVVLRDGDQIVQDELTFKVKLTKGHTNGSVIYIVVDSIFAGDTIFCCSIGRTDFYSGNPSAMRESLRDIYSLGGSYHIYSGHGEATTLAFERENNPYMTGFAND